MAQLTLVIGGVRSGKSRWAEEQAAAWTPVTYLATALAGDEDMARRIARHRERRGRQPHPWRTIEEPVQIARVVTAHADGCLLLECLPLWLMNLLGGLADYPPRDDAQVREAVAELVAAIRSAGGRVIVVSNEVGCGIMPANNLARRFGDLLGEANQELARAASAVVWCVAGIPVRIKGDASPL